jgi:hypothetical protein
VRYGSCLPIVAIGFVTVATYHRSLRDHIGPYALGLMALVVLLVPHLVMSRELTGTITGALRISGAIPPPPQSALAYLERPLVTYGPLIAPLCAIGVLAARQSISRVVLVRIAVLHVIALSVTTAAQPRYAYFGTVLLVILGVDAIVCLVRVVEPRARIALGAVALLAVGVAWTSTLASASSYAATKGQGPAQVLMAAKIVANDRAGPCEVVGPDLTRLEWYSGCRGVHVPSGEAKIALYVIRDGRDGSLEPGARRLAYLPGVLDVVRVR